MQAALLGQRDRIAQLRQGARGLDVSERQLLRAVRSYVAYCNEDRPHLALAGMLRARGQSNRRRQERSSRSPGSEGSTIATRGRRDAWTGFSPGRLKVPGAHPALAPAAPNRRA